MRPTTGISNTDAFARNRGQRPEYANCPTARGSALEMWFATKMTPPVCGTLSWYLQSRLVSGLMIALRILTTVEIVCPPGS